MDETQDVVVIGGGAAGLAGAVALARSRRSVLVVDAGEPRNALAGHVHNFLTRDGTPPAELYDQGRDEVLRYGGRVERARVVAVRRVDDGFAVELPDRTVTARRLLVATGARDELPPVDGLAERWGVDVLHCPYCHGWEVRDRRIGVLATGPLATHQALLFRQLSADVTFLAHTGPAPTAEQAAQLAALHVPLVTGTVERVEADATGLTGVRLADGTRVALDALVVAPRCVANAELLAPLGLTAEEMRVGDHVVGRRGPAGQPGAPAAPGGGGAGTGARVPAPVIRAAGAGLTAGAAINLDLVAEDAAKAVAYEELMGERAWEERYRARDHIWSGHPNPTLVTETADLPPGTALDAGAGEGADACWLAARGWKVVGVDLSTTALERAAAHAAERGVDVTWQHADLTREPAPGTFDLVTAHFLHYPPAQRRIALAHLTEAVAPGGTLLVVGHDPRDTAIPRPAEFAGMNWTVEDLATTLGPGWEIETCEARPRPARHPDGHEVTIHDAVLRARRVAGPA